MPVPIRVIHQTDPKQLIWDECGTMLQGMQPLADRVLVVVYERTRQGGKETKTEGGIYIPESFHKTNAAEQDYYQGRVGLLIAKGELAFEEDATHKWGKRKPEVGDWIMFDTVNTSPFDVPDGKNGSRRARFVQDVYVEAIVPDEVFDAIW